MLTTLSCSGTCSPQLSAADGASEDEGGKPPATLLSGSLDLAVDQIFDNALIACYGLDPLAGTLSPVAIRVRF